MARLAPWPRDRRVAVAVSGGADSMCLALLTKGWGTPIGLIIDHGLRAESADEAGLTQLRLARLGMPSEILIVRELAPGPGLAARARAARYAALAAAAAGRGLSDLLLGHHAGDQAETVLMRAEAGSGPAGLAGMPGVAFRDGMRLVRPLLGVAPSMLRATLVEAGIAWVDDPSNSNPAALRTRLRARLADGDETGRLMQAAGRAATRRAAQDREVAAQLAARARLFSEGYAVLSPGAVMPEALAALIRVVGGRVHGPGREAVRALAEEPRPSTLGGVRLLPAGRLGLGLLLVRETAAMAPALEAADGVVWDGRFRLVAEDGLPAGSVIAALGPRAAGFRGRSQLPAAVLQTLPCLERSREVYAVPQLGYFTGWTNLRLRVTLNPPEPACGAPWVGDAEPARYHHVAS